MSHYKPYPAYRDSGVEWIGRVPKHWARAAIKHILSEPITDGPHETPVFLNEGVEFLSVDGIQDGELVFEGKRFISYEDHARFCKKAKPQINDVLVGKSASVGKVARVKTSNDFNVWSPLAILRSDPTKCNPAYLEFALKADSAQQQILLAGNTSTQANIGMDRLASVGIPLPPITEQFQLTKAIEQETTSIDALITKKTRFIELLKEKRQALITHAVTKGLDPSVKMRDSGIDWIGEVPEQWNVVQVRHVATLGSGHTPSRSRPDWWEDCYIPWFTLADIWQVRREGRRFVTETEEKVSDLGIANSSAVVHPAGSVMLSRTASVGFPAIMGCDMATSQDFAVWRCGSRVVNEYLYLVLLGMKQELSRLMIGSTHKTIYMPDIEAFRMPLPSVEQQKLIIQYVGDELQRFDTLVAKTQRSIDLLRERRAAFITAAVTGQIDLRESA